MQRQIDKLEKDTYKVRKAEGRPKHGQTSFTILGVGVVSWFMLVVAMLLPEWRSNWIGMMGYPHKRSWGLFTVSGMKSHMHHEAMTDACRYYSQLNVGGVCASPICLWYRMKCQVYMDIAMISYATGFCFFLCLIWHTLCLVWTSRMTPRMIRWAAIWWTAQMIVHISVTVFWWLMTSEAFASLDSQSLYPEPDFSFCFFLECLVIMCVGTNSMLAITLMKMWPESSSGSGSSDSEDDSTGNEGDGAPPMGNGGPPPPGAFPPGAYGGPPTGYDPSGPPPAGPGMMGGPPMMGGQMMGGPPQEGFGLPPPAPGGFQQAF